MNYLKCLLIILILAGMAACSSGESATNNKEEKIHTNVQVAVLKPEKFSNYLETIGFVKPLIDIPMIAEESGIVVKIVAKKGKMVRKGQLIAILENKVLYSQLQQAKAAYLSDSLNLEQSKELKNVNGISDVALKQAEYKKNMSEANYHLLLARFAKLKIKAPINGLLDQRFFDAGRFVPPMSQFCHIIKINKVKVTVGIPERYAGQISENNTIFVSFDAFGERTFSSKISFVGSVVDPKNRTFPIEILIDNPGRILKPNMVANVKLQLYELSNRLVIPKNAVIDEGESQLAYIKKGDYAIERKLLIEDVYRENALLSAGLDFGDSLIVLGNRDLVDSTLIKVTKVLEK